MNKQNNLQLEKTGRKKILVAIFLAMALLLPILTFVSVKKTRLTSIPRAKSLPPVKEQAVNELISGFPDFPEHPGGKILVSSKEIRDPQVIFTADWEVNEKGEILLSWYFDELIKGGWIIEQSEQFLKATDLRQTDKTLKSLFL